MRTEEEIRRARDNGRLAIGWMEKVGQSEEAISHLADMMDALSWVLGELDDDPGLT